MLLFVTFSIIGAKRQKSIVHNVVMFVFASYALYWVVFTLYVWIQHLSFPLNLEAMELTVLQHLQRIMDGKLVYVEPSSEFVPLAYAPLYYYVSLPFAWIFGASLFTLRLVAVLAAIGCGIVIFLIATEQTRSVWWSVIAVGLFAAAYRVMDTYLDNAHSDSWLLFCVLLGCYLIEKRSSRVTDVIGILCLITSFWFKQHGALFAIGGVLYLTWRDGIAKAWLYWMLALLFGPILYVLAPTLIFGPLFHYYTFTVPSNWSELNFDAIKRFAVFVVKNYVLLAGVGVIAPVLLLMKKIGKINIWYFMLPFALLSGFMGALDPGSNNNVFIPMGVWFILTGVLGLYTLAEHFHATTQWSLHLLVIGVSFSLFFYQPGSVVISPKAPDAYQDLVTYLNSFEGTVYAPWLGPLETGYKFSPTVHWVPMEDLIRGPGVNVYDHPNTRRLLDSVINPAGDAYILMNYPLENDPLLSFLLEYYQLETDLGDRFAPLTTLPKRFNLDYPRYLYTFQP
jgi:4-amino-4-deoxy-L-arabinose transferase-like glycosyltransferase